MTAAERDAHVVRLFPIVRVIARRVARICRVRDVDDLIGEGSIGLIRAIDGFDASRGVAIDRYARRSIFGAMLNGIRRNDPVSERARRLMRRAERIADEHAARGAPPSARELERFLPGLVKARCAVERGLPLSLDAALPPGQSLTVDWSEDPARLLAREARYEHVRTALGALPDRQRRLLVAHYFDEIPLRAISARWAVTPQRVSQIHLSALSRLRRAVGTEAPP